MLNKIKRISWDIIKQPNSTKVFIGHFLRFTHLCEVLKLKIKKNSIVLNFAPTSLSTTLWANNQTSSDELFIENYLKNGDTFVDIGANIWHLTILGAKIVSTKGRVIAIEPNQKIYNYLKKNIAENNLTNIRPINFAVWEKMQKTMMKVWHADDMWQINTTAWIPVNMETLDHIYDQYSLNHIDLIKIDVEGYEKFVLEWGEKALKNTQTLYIEANESFYNQFGYTSKDISQILSKHWFSPFWIYNNILFPYHTHTIHPLWQNIIWTKDQKSLSKRCKLTLYTS